MRCTEDAETIEVTASYDGTPIGTAQVTINDDEGAPTVALALSPAAIDEDGGVSTVTARVSPAAAQPFTVTVTAAAVDPATEVDFMLSADTTLSFAAEATAGSATVTVTAKDNDVDAPDKQVTVSATVSGTDVTAPADVTLTIRDDDAPDWELTVDPSAIDEDGGTATVTVSTGGVSFPEERTIGLAFAGDAMPGSDFTVADAGGDPLESPYELTLAAGASEATATVTARDDQVDDDDESILVTASYEGTPIGTAQVTITDDDGTPAVTLVLSHDAIDEDGGVSAVTARVSPAAAQPFTVTVTAAGVDPAMAADFRLSDNTTLSFAAEATTSSGEVTVRAVNNDVDAPDKTVTVSGTASGATVTAPADETLTITDEDEPEWVVSADRSAIAEAGGSSTVTVGTGGITFPDARTIALSLAGTATLDSDYRVEDADDRQLASSAELTLAAGASALTVTITALDDQVDDNAETIVVAARYDGAAIGEQQTVTITDDEGTPSVALLLTPESISENGGISAVTATATPASAQPFTVTVSAQAVAPATAADFRLSDNTTLSFTAGATESSGEVSVLAANNDVDEPNNKVRVAGAPSAATVTAPASVLLTITDDDEPDWDVTANPAAIAEDGGSATVTVSTGGVTFRDDLTIRLSFAGQATPGRDFMVADADDSTLASPYELELAAGESAVTATITALDDQVDDNGESILVTARYQGVVIGEQQNVTIIDDEGTPAVTLMLSPDAVSERDGVSRVTATVTPAAAQPFTVTVSAAEVDPATAADFTLSASTTLSFAAEATASSGEVTVAAENDAVDAPDKEVRVSGAVSGASVTAPADVTLTITDDDAPAWAVTVDPAAIVEDGGVATVTVTTGGVTFPEDRTIRLSFGGDATPGRDFTVADAFGNAVPSPYALTLAAGEMSLTATIEAQDDQVDDDAEEIVVSALHAGTVIGLQPTVTIIDDEGTPVVTLALSQDRIAEDGGVSTVTATVAPAAAQPFTVTVAAHAVDPAIAAEFTLSADATLSFAAEATAGSGQVKVTAVPDVVDAPDTEVTVSGAVSGANVTAPAAVTLTIADDDVPVWAVTVDPGAIVEDGGVATVTVSTGGVTFPDDRTIRPAFTGNATFGSDFLLTDGAGNPLPLPPALTLAVGASAASLRIVAVDDQVDDDAETIQVTARYQGAVIGQQPTVTITDDEGTPAVTLVLSPAAIAEDGGVSAVTATVMPAAAQPFTVTVAAQAVDPATAVDFTLSADTTLSFAPEAMESSGVVTVTARDDDVDAPDKTVTVSGTVSGANVTPPSNVTLIIADEDVPAWTVAVNRSAIDEAGGTATLTVDTGGVTFPEDRTIRLSFAGDATPGKDYVVENAGGTELVLPYDVPLATGRSVVTATIRAVDDEVDDNAEQIQVTARHAGATIGGQRTVTITDDEGTPAVTLELSPNAIDESGGVSVVSATVTPAAASAFTVTVAAAPVTPAVATDFTLSADTTLSFAAEAMTSSGEVTVKAVNNLVDAPDKTVTVSGTASGATVTAPADETLTITDDDEPDWTVTVHPSAIDEAGGEATVTVSTGGVTFPDGRTIALVFAGSATPGSDYTVADAGGNDLSSPADVTLAAGASEMSATITAVDDQVDDNAETIAVTARYRNAQIGEEQTVTITDDEGTPSLTLVLTPAAIDESAGVSEVTATVTPAAASAFTVTVAAAPVLPAVADDFALSADTTLSFAAAATASSGTVTITAMDNEVDAPDRKVTVSATATSADVTAPADVALTITDDDEPTWAVTVVPLAIDEAGGEATVTVSTGGVTFPDDRTIRLSFAGDATPGSDYTVADPDGHDLASNELTLAAGASRVAATITAVDDLVDDNAEQIEVTASYDGAAIGALQTVTITDDEGTPTVTLVLSPDAISRKRRRERGDGDREAGGGGGVHGDGGRAGGGAGAGRGLHAERQHHAELCGRGGREQR